MYKMYPDGSWSWQFVITAVRGAQRQNKKTGHTVNLFIIRNFLSNSFGSIHKPLLNIEPSKIIHDDCIFYFEFQAFYYKM